MHDRIRSGIRKAKFVSNNTRHNNTTLLVYCYFSECVCPIQRWIWWCKG